MLMEVESDPESVSGNQSPPKVNYNTKFQSNRLITVVFSNPVHRRIQNDRQNRQTQKCATDKPT